MDKDRYWVEARCACKDHSRVIGYGVWWINPKGARECVKLWKVTKRQPWDIALYLANLLRDDLNAGIA